MRKRIIIYACGTKKIVLWTFNAILSSNYPKLLFEDNISDDPVSQFTIAQIMLLIFT